MAQDNPLAGFHYLLQGLELIRRPDLRNYVTIPLLINILIFIGLLWLGIDQFDNFMTHYLPDQKLPGWLPEWMLGWSWLSWIIEAFRSLAWILFAVAFLFIFIYGFTLVANLLGAPFNDLLAAKTEELLVGHKPENTGSIFSAIGSSLTQELQKIGYFASRGLPLLVLFVIPPLNLLAPLAWGLFSAWSLAVEYMEFPMGNHAVRFKTQRELLRRNRLTALGFGGGVMLIMAIPVINFTAMPAAVCGATAWWSERLKRQLDT